MIQPMKKGRRRRPARPFSNSIILSACTSRGIRQERAKTINHQIDGTCNIRVPSPCIKAVVSQSTERYGHEHTAIHS
jgi:hypothetical protein